MHIKFTALNVFLKTCRPALVLIGGLMASTLAPVSVRQNIAVGDPGSFQFLRLAVEEN